jgi:TPR repeat protein
MRALQSMRHSSVLVLVSLLAFVIYLPSAHSLTVDPGKLEADADRGSVLAEIELAANYVTGKGVVQDMSRAAHWYEKAAQQGNPEAQNEIGYFYQVGLGVPVDLSRAVRWYQLSASFGIAAAKLNLGILYAKGIGVPKNMELAIQYLQEATQKGNGRAAAYLGDIYYFGLAGSPDAIAAEKWFNLGVRLHDPVAAYNLGSLFSVNANHQHDFRKAADLLRRSAGDGYVPAMHSLGLLLINHPEVEQTSNEARSLLEVAADAGSWRSSILLGILARDGRGIPTDKKAAVYRFQLAALQGGEEAEHLVRLDLNKLSAELGAEQCAAVSSKAESWYIQHRSSKQFIANSQHTEKYFPLPADLEIKETFASQVELPPDL